jgi:hypothetical protein
MDPNHKWAGPVAMSTFIILITLVVLSLDYLGKVKSRNNYVRAVPATARIVKVSRSIGNGTYGGRIVNITLEVIPPEASPYRVKTNWCVEPLALAKIKAEDIVAIRIDAKKPDRIYSSEQWAWHLGQIPLRFGNHIPFLYIDR